MIDKAKLRNIASDIEAAIQEVGKKHGVQLKRGNASYTDTNFTLKIEGAAIDSSGEILSREKQDFMYYALSYGLSPDDFGKTFISRGRTFKISGLKPKASKYSILAEEVGTGKSFKFPATAVKQALNNSSQNSFVAPPPRTTSTIPGGGQVDSNKIPEHLRHLIKG